MYCSVTTGSNCVLFCDYRLGRAGLGWAGLGSAGFGLAGRGMKLPILVWFWRFGVPKLCNCQQIDVEIELSLEFWAPRVARIEARA